MQLELQHRRNGIRVIVTGIVVDMRFRRGIAEFFAALAVGFDALEVAHVLPPPFVPLVLTQILRIHIGFPMGHGARTPKDEWDGTGQGVVEQEGGLVRLKV